MLSVSWAVGLSVMISARSNPNVAITLHGPGVCTAFVMVASFVRVTPRAGAKDGTPAAASSAAVIAFWGDRLRGNQKASLTASGGG
jgi:hypothetical protein